MYCSAKILAHSVAPSGQEITSWELEYPRMIHSEFMTHRTFSRNGASSRAIPIRSKIKFMRKGGGFVYPLHYGAKQKGMQAENELQGWRRWAGEKLWGLSGSSALFFASMMDRIGGHKQWVNRILEPYERYKVVMTTTSHDNFFWLRAHPDAQPEIKQLAEQMRDAYYESRPIPLGFDGWHVPYFYEGFWIPNAFDESLEDALAISSSCCAQISYRRSDDSLDKAKRIYARLVDAEPVHASPFEHQATPIRNICTPGVTHTRLADNMLCSGNFEGWAQYRQIIPNNTCYHYEG